MVIEKSGTGSPTSSCRRFAQAYFSLCNVKHHRPRGRAQNGEVAQLVVIDDAVLLFDVQSALDQIARGEVFQNGAIREEEGHRHRGHESLDLFVSDRHASPLQVDLLDDSL